MKKSLIKFEKFGCVPCVQMQNVLDENDIEVIKYQVFDEPELASKYDIGSVPTLILLDEDDNEITRTVGFNKDEIRELITEI